MKALTSVLAAAAPRCFGAAADRLLLILFMPRLRLVVSDELLTAELRLRFALGARSSLSLCESSA